MKRTITHPLKNCKNLYAQKQLEEEQKQKTDPNVNQLCSFTINFGEQMNITIKGVDFSSKTHCKNGKVYNFISNTCEEFSCPKGYKGSISRCFKDKHVLRNLTRFKNNAVLNKCYAPNKTSMIIKN